MSASCSIDNGATWLPTGSISQQIKSPRIGLLVGSAGSPATFRVQPSERWLSPRWRAPVESFAFSDGELDAIRDHHPTNSPTPTPSSTAPGGAQRRDVRLHSRVAGRDLADGWDFLAKTPLKATRNTERTTGATAAYSAGGLQIPGGLGGPCATASDTRNTVFRDLSSELDGRAVATEFSPTQNYQHAGILIYSDDDNYVELTRAYNSFAGGQSVVMISESGGVPSESPRVGFAATELTLRIDRNPSTNVLTGHVSTVSGATWQQVGSIARGLNDPRFGINVVYSPSRIPCSHDPECKRD